LVLMRTRYFCSLNSLMTRARSSIDKSPISNAHRWPNWDICVCRYLDAARVCKVVFLNDTPLVYETNMTEYHRLANGDRVVQIVYGFKFRLTGFTIHIELTDRVEHLLLTFYTALTFTDTLTKCEQPT
jgi:hypothetical protein